ncbi:MAG: reverse transcriptase family protein [Aeromonas sp.]
MTKYNPHVLKSIRNTLLSRTSSESHIFDDLDRFKRTISRKIKRAHLASIGKLRKHRAGFQVALRKCQTCRLSIPAIISTNVRSLPSKITDLKALIHLPMYEKCGLILLQETWLHEDIDSELISIEGYQTHRLDRNCTFTARSGGVATYVKNKWCSASKCVFTYNTRPIACLAIECKPRYLTGFSTLIVTNVYVTPQTSTSDISVFLDSFVPFVTSTSNSFHIVAGDFNRAHVDITRMCHLTNVVTFTTRDDAKLDLAFVTDASYFYATKKAPLGNSDHCIIKLLPRIYSRSMQRAITTSRFHRIHRRKCDEDSMDQLRHMLDLTDFEVLADDDISVECDTITEYLNFCFDICCPVETILIRPDRFASPLLKHLRRNKEKAFKIGDKKRIKLTTSLIAAELKRLEHLYVKTLLGDKSCKELWNGLKLVCGKTRPKVRFDGDINELNRSFLTASNGSNLLVNTLTTPISDTPPTIIDSEKTLNKLLKLNVNKATGLDRLSPVILKQCAHQLTPIVTKILNRCVTEAKIPDNWRVVRITPVPKKDITKFRPIACTPILLKVLEGLILDRMKSTVPLTDTTQFAYRQQRSTLDAVACLHNKISLAIDERRGPFSVCFLDFSNAFNCVDRKKLLEDLDSQGTDSHILNWLTDYFTNRCQMTIVDNQKSDVLPITTGVLQGAILSPYLFSMYLNDLPNTVDVFAYKYADDVVVGCSSGGANCTTPIQTSLDSINSWSSIRSLILNPSKCKVVTFCPSRNLSRIPTLPPVLKLGNDSLEVVNTFKYLGVTFNSNLSWSSHVILTFNKVRKLTFYVTRLRSLSIPNDAIRLFVQSCLLVHWLYCSPVVFPAMLAKDFVLLRRSLKCISRCSDIPLYELNTFISEKHFSACTRFADCVLNDLSHPLHLILSRCLSSSSTRRKFKLIYSRTTVYRNSCIPYLARFLTTPHKIIEELSSHLS